MEQVARLAPKTATRLWLCLVLLTSIGTSATLAAPIVPQSIPDDPLVSLASTANTIGVAARPFLAAKPLESTYTTPVTVNSFFDHKLPAYGDEQLETLPANLRDATRSTLLTFMGEELSVSSLNFGYNSYSGHNGVDYQAFTGREVRAPASGHILLGSEAMVLLTDQDGTPILKDKKRQYVANTCLVWIGHDTNEPVDGENDASTVYMHLSRIAPASDDQRTRPERNSTQTTWIAGDYIRKGELIGYSGNDPCGGGSSGPHLHFGVSAGAANRYSPSIYDPFGWWSRSADPWADLRLSEVRDLDPKPSSSSWAWAAAPLPRSPEPGYQGPDVLALTDDSDPGFQIFGPSARRSSLTALLPAAGQTPSPIGTGAWTTTSIAADSAATRKNWGVWGLHIPATGRYRIQAHVPRLPTGAQATTTARYTVAYPDSMGAIVRWESNAVDQQATTGWTDIVQAGGEAVVTLQGGTVALVALSDVTGTAGQKVIFDAIRLHAEGSITLPGNPARTIPIGLAIDNSSSMADSGKIDAVKKALPRWIDQLTGLNIKLAFGFEPFANTTPPVRQTTDPAQIKALVQSLSANDNGSPNGECPEESLGAIRLLAPAVAGGQMLLFTDDVPFSPEQGKVSTLQELARSGVKLHAIILPKTCTLSGGNDFTAYRYLTENTGGTYQAVPTNQTASALQIVLNEIRADAQIPTTPAQANLAATGPATSRLIVDGTVTKLNVLLNILSGAPTLSLVRPNGTVASAGPDVAVTVTAGAIYYNITAPEPGEWQAVVSGSGEYRLSSSVESPIQFGYFGQMQGPIGKPIEALARLSGPIASANFAVELRGGQRLPVDLRDDGRRNDAVAGDSVYSGWLTVPTEGIGVLRVDGTTQAGSAFTRVDTRQIRILPVALTAPPAAVMAAGDSLTLTFMLSNLGSGPRNFILSTAAPASWITGLPPQTVRLAAGEERAIPIVVTVPSGAAGMGLVSIELTAVASDDSATVADAETAISIATASGPVPPTSITNLPVLRR